MKCLLSMDVPLTQPIFVSRRAASRWHLVASTMFVKTMVVEGFKSYGQRVQIDGFDPAFNAITGLNG